MVAALSGLGGLLPLTIFAVFGLGAIIGLLAIRVLVDARSGPFGSRAELKSKLYFLRHGFFKDLHFRAPSGASTCASTRLRSSVLAGSNIKAILYFLSIFTVILTLKRLFSKSTKGKINGIHPLKLSQEFLDSNKKSFLCGWTL